MIKEEIIDTVAVSDPDTFKNMLALDAEIKKMFPDAIYGGSGKNICIEDGSHMWIKDAVVYVIGSKMDIPSIPYLLDHPIFRDSDIVLHPIDDWIELNNKLYPVSRANVTYTLEPIPTTDGLAKLYAEKIDNEECLTFVVDKLKARLERVPLTANEKSLLSNYLDTITVDDIGFISRRVGGELINGRIPYPSFISIGLRTAVTDTCGKVRVAKNRFISGVTHIFVREHTTSGLPRNLISVDSNRLTFLFGEEN